MSASRIDENNLTKGQRRNLNALRKSVGDEVGERAFAEWLSSHASATSMEDANAARIVDTLRPLMQQGTFARPCSGYALRRGRAPIIVEPARSKPPRREWPARQRQFLATSTNLYIPDPPAHLHSCPTSLDIDHLMVAFRLIRRSTGSADKNNAWTT